ncbi:MAG: hypothetical protein QOF84_5725 [Streptomyces sp.]|nr:hypothetical protein [Streptomyces sp.]
MAQARGSEESEFANAVRHRVREAHAALAAAIESEDAYAAAVAADEVDDALRIAREHGIATNPAPGADGARNAAEGRGRDVLEEAPEAGGRQSWSRFRKCWLCGGCFHRADGAWGSGHGRAASCSPVVEVGLTGPCVAVARDRYR